MKRRALTVEGMMRGIDFRSFVFQLLRQHGLAGCILNRGMRIHIEVQGETSELIGFAEALRSQPLAPMCIDGITSRLVEPSAGRAPGRERRVQPLGLAGVTDRFEQLHAS
ncbi:MAG: acylphosphatase [Phycisphaerales bacterium]|nr:acylphosphatase [Phycisphaerales bacterium]